jgi:hypothetical protein
VLNRAVFVILMSWTATAYDGMISSNSSILLYVNLFQFTIYVFIGIDDKRKNHANNRLDYQANEICDKTIKSRSIIVQAIETNF